MQWDPHLSQLLLEEPALRDPTRPVAVIARLVDPDVPVPHLDIVVRVGHIVTGRVQVAHLRDVRRDRNVASLKRSLDYYPHDVAYAGDVTAPVSPAATTQRPWTGRGVIVGFADWGFDFAHPDFIDEHGRSRFLLLWDQLGGATPTSPAPYGYGRVWDNAAINRALATPDPYATLGYDPAVFDRAGRGMHGTHTLGIACGNGRAAHSRPSAAWEASIIAVHLRGDDTRVSDTLGDSSRIVEALDFIFTRAGQFGRSRGARTPVVVNMSLGRCGGPHDSSPLVVQALDEMLDQAPDRVIVMSAGNYYSTGQHASGQLLEGHTLEWQWLVAHPISQVAELEIWYASADQLAVDLVDPKGRLVCRLEPGDEHVERTDGEIVMSAFHRPHDPNNNDSVVDIFLWPRAPAGTWHVRIRPRRVECGVVHGWIERVYGGSQSRLHLADPIFTTNTVCNGRRTIAVAAIDPHSAAHIPGRFSSAGPARDLRSKPDIAAPGVGITAAKSTVVINGVRQRGGLATMSGTSMAAPHVTSAVAVLLQASDRPLWAGEVRHLLCETATPGLAPVDRVGHGIVDIDAALARLTERRDPPIAWSSTTRAGLC